MKKHFLGNETADQLIHPGGSHIKALCIYLHLQLQNFVFK